MFPEWLDREILETLDPVEGFFIEKIRQRELTNPLGQVTCEDHRVPELWPLDDPGLWPCPTCGAAV